MIKMWSTEYHVAAFLFKKQSHLTTQPIISLKILLKSRFYDESFFFKRISPLKYIALTIIFLEFNTSPFVRKVFNVYYIFYNIIKLSTWCTWLWLPILSITHGYSNIWQFFNREKKIIDHNRVIKPIFDSAIFTPRSRHLMFSLIFRSFSPKTLENFSSHIK
jgi:hypothetical protein